MSWRTVVVACTLAAACSAPAPRPDAGPGDAGGGDAGAMDASVDAGPSDAGNVDHGMPSTTYPAYAIDWPQLVGTDAGVIAQPRIVAITFDGDPLRSELERFFASVGATAYWHTTTSEYGVGPAEGLPPVHLSEPAPAFFTDLDVRSYLTQHLSSADAGWPMPDGRTIYVLHYPATTMLELNGLRSCSFFGAYHQVLMVGGVNVPYAVIARCPTDPGNPPVSTDLGQATRNVSHELVEAVTDFGVNGYALPDDAHISFATFAGAETGDMCEFSPAASIVDAELNLTVQRTWSNQEALAGREPCVPAPMQPATYAVPAFPGQVAIAYNGASLMTPGVSLAMGETATVPLLLVSSGATDAFTVSVVDRMEYFGQGKSLSLQLDRASGVNGEKLYLSITRVGTDPNFGGAMPFMIQGELNGARSTWFAAVGAKP